MTTSVTLALLAAIWLGVVIRAYYNLSGLRELPNATPKSAAAAGKVSLLVPARNEERDLEKAAGTLLDSRYTGQLELILVDDRSTDRTPQIVDHLEETDPRVTAIHVGQLPEGWLGKVHALKLA